MFCRKDILGEGSKGTCVYKGMFDGSIPVAVKRMVYFITTDWNEVMREVKTLKKMDHPNVIRYRLFDKDKDFVYIALDLCDNSLIECLNKLGKNPRYSGKSEEKMRFKISLLRDILKGLGYLHKMGIIHRDLKPQNVLVKKDVTAEFKAVAVITDFGLSVEIPNGQSHVTATEGGSKGWIAREMLDNVSRNRDIKGKKKFKKGMDIFSFGCIAQMVLFSTSDSSNKWAHPFGNEKSRERNIFLGKRVALLTHPLGAVDYHSLLADLMIGMCVCNNPALRPTTEDLINFPFFWDFAKGLHFLEKIFNDFKDKFGEESMVKELETNWQKYTTESFAAKIPEAWGYHVFCRKEAKQGKPSEKSLFNGLLRNMRNIRQHCIEATGRYTVTHKHAGSKEETKLDQVLGSKSDEDIGRYFLGRIPFLLPVTYLTFFEHARQQSILQEYYKNTGDCVFCVKSAWSTMDRLTGTGKRSSSRSRSKTRSN